MMKSVFLLMVMMLSGVVGACDNMDHSSGLAQIVEHAILHGGDKDILSADMGHVWAKA